MKSISIIFTLLFASAGLSAQTIAPTQTDVIIIDNGTTGKADPADRIRYTVTIMNTANPSGTGVQLNIVPDPRTTFVAGTFRSSPLALPDAYTSTGNVGIIVSAANGLKTNDFDDAIAGATIVAGTFATTGGGSITIASNGSFTYSPAAGFTGADTYTYTLNDGNPVGLPVPLTDMATVTITVSNMIWFVDNTGGGSGGTGTLANPFKTLGNFNASTGPQAGQLIFIKNTGTNYNGGIVLKNDQILFGTGHTGGTTLADVLPFLLAPNSPPLPIINSGSGPIITNTSAGGDGVSLAQNNQLRGFNVWDCGDFAMDNQGTGSIGNLFIREVNIVNSTGGGFDAGNGSGAGMDVLLNQLITQGGVNGINLSNCAGTFAASAGLMSSSSGPTVLISGGTVTVSLVVDLSENSGFIVDIDNHDSNNITFSKTLNGIMGQIRVQNCNGGIIAFTGNSKSISSGANPGVVLTNNAGATINFTNGGLVIITSSGIGFDATGGATAINVTGSGNAITTASGIALNVVNTTIGGSGITFQSINKNGGNTANSAIVLTGTGSGTCTVSGTGSAGTGGTIQNIQGADAIRLSTTGGLVSLTNVIIQDISASNDATAANNTRSNVDAIHGTAINGGLTLIGVTIQRISDDGINGSVDGVNPTATTWNGLTLNNCTIQNTNRFNVAGHADAQVEGAIYMFGLNGTVSITGCNFNNAGSGMDITTHTSGTLDMTVTGNSFTTLYKETGGTASVGLFGISIVQQGSLSSIIRIGDKNETNAALGNMFTNGGHVCAIRLITNTGSTQGMKSVLSKNTFTVTDHSSPGFPSGNMTFNFPQSGVLLRQLGSGLYESIFSNNVFDQCMHADGGLGNLSLIMENGNSELQVTGNTFGLCWDAPVELRADGQSGGQASCAVLFNNNTYIDGLVGAVGDDLGAPFQSPYVSFYTQVRNNGRMDFTIQNDILPLNDPASGFPNSFHCQTTSAGDILNLFLSNDKSPSGYKLQQNAGTTYNLTRGLSVSNVPQTILQNNNCTGGAGNDNTSPPTVVVVGTITPVNSVPALPMISGF